LRWHSKHSIITHSKAFRTIPHYNLDLSQRNIMQRIIKPAFSFSRRTLHTSRPLALGSWSAGPSPPRLPKDEQEIFEQLQKQSTGAFSTPSARPEIKINQSPQSTESTESTVQSTEASLASEVKLRANVKDGEELHPNIRRGAAPEFQGEVNPKTGEAGGPKNEPLRWGHSSDWSYNGRATDF